MHVLKHICKTSCWAVISVEMQSSRQVEQQRMSAGDLKQQLAVATAEGAEHNEKAIQASALVDTLQTQVCFPSMHDPKVRIIM